MLDLILLLMASGEEGLNILFLMLEFLTLVHHLIIRLLIVATDEREKRRQYEQRVGEVEHGHFTPLVFTATGGMGA